MSTPHSAAPPTVRPPTLEALPVALARQHRLVELGQPTTIELPVAAGEATAPPIEEVVARGGFDVVAVRHTADHRQVEATAAFALPDHVAPGMRLLCCGLNPSLHAARAGVGYVSPSNRFWPALLAAGLATRDRDPLHLLAHHGIGTTDLVRRPTPRADELTPDEHRAGVARLERLCRWLRPAAVAVVGLSGWRAAVDRRAAPGWQGKDLGGSPVYLLPSTSGLNACTSLDALVAHLQAAARRR